MEKIVSFLRNPNQMQSSQNDFDKSIAALKETDEEKQTRIWKELNEMSQYILTSPIDEEGRRHVYGSKEFITKLRNYGFIVDFYHIEIDKTHSLAN